MVGGVTRCTVWTQFSGHQPLLAFPITHLDDLSRAEFGKSETPERFSMNENVLRSSAAGEETEAFEPVEPLHHRPLPVAFGDDMDMGALGKLRRMNRRALIHLDDAERLKPAVAP